MDKQMKDNLKKFIQESQFSVDAKDQLLSLMDFVDTPEIKQRILEILDVEEQVTDIELKHLQELEQNLRSSDLFGYQKGGVHIPSQTRQNIDQGNSTNNQVNVNTQNVQSTTNIPQTETNTQVQNSLSSAQQNPTVNVQPQVQAV